MGVRIEPNAEPVPGYRLIERLGGGGFGEVWKCEAPGGLLKAIKFVFGTLETAGDSGQRAEQELKALSRVKTVRHPYVLSLERYDIIESQLVIIMELADRNLWDRFRECRGQGLQGIPREELLGYMEETAEALDLMNSQYQLQHLDIKPQNIFLIHNHVKVADFGLVKDLEGSQASVTGGITPVYAAPETFDGKVSRFSDQYSLAIVFQELLTGQRPFAGVNVRQLILQHLQSPPNVTPLEEPDRPAIMRALSKEPNERFPTCRDLIRALRTPSAGPAAAARASENLPIPGGESATEMGLSRVEPTRGPVAESPATSTSETPSVRETAPVRPSGVISGSDATQMIRKPGRTAPAPEPVPEHAAHVYTPEPDGDGLLFPALLVGLGGVGYSVLQSFRAALGDRFGAPDSLPHLRTLVIDTDPDVVRLANAASGKDRGSHHGALTAAEVLLAPLNRPSHYLRPHAGRIPVDTWMNARMLYRIPREQVTTGIRTLGRLAYCDNYRSIRRRLQAELEACLELGGLDQASRNTGLGLRSRRPRIYIVSSLMGGTGSGMFLDLAYSVRQLLKQFGHPQAEINALLFVPELESRGSQHRALRPSTQGLKPSAVAASVVAGQRMTALGNTCAALAELHHFAGPRATFVARYLDNETPVSDTGSPFNRIVMLNMPEASDTRGAGETLGQAARFLLGETASPLGKAANRTRGQLPSPQPSIRGRYFETIGLYRLSFPHRQIVRRVALQALRRVVERWMSKETRPLAEPVREWVAEQWSGNELGPEHFIVRVRQACATKLRKEPELAMADALDPIGRLGPGNKAKQDAAPTPADVVEALRRVEALLGRPEAEEPARPKESTRSAEFTDGEPPLLQALQQSGAELAAEWSEKLAELPVRLIEKPAFRLAGAEEAIRQVVASVERVLQHHEPLSKELSIQAAQAYDRLLKILPGIGDGKSWPRRVQVNPDEIVELVRCFAKWRYQSQVLNQVAAVYVSLRGHLSDELREINFCRVRLLELLQQLEDPVPKDEQGNPRPVPARDPAAEGPGEFLFPDGGADIHAVVQHAANALTAADLLELDERLQKMIRSQFVALVQICLAGQSVARNLTPALRQVAEEFIAEKLPSADVVSLLLKRNAADNARSELLRLYEEAIPIATRTAQGRAARPRVEQVVLALPDGPDSATIVREARQAIVESGSDDNPPVITSTSGEEDLVVYREWSNLELSDLEHLGPVGREAYQQMLSAENFTPHSRIDVEFPLPQ